ncbi:MAG: flippase [Methanosarcinaceae archaeon]|nr:flippase [Methanosarcinaceae archaeon]
MKPITQSRHNRPEVTGRLRTHLIKGAAGSFVIQMGFAGLAFFNSILLARLLGAGGYGAFANAMAWISLLVIAASFGFGTLLVRDVAIYRSRREWAAFKGLLRFSDCFALALSATLSIIVFAVAGCVFPETDKEAMRLSLWVAAPLVPLFALSSLRESAARGLEHVFRALLPGMIFRPGLLLTGIVAIYLFWPDLLSAPAAMAVNVCTAAIALVAGEFWLRRLLPSEVKRIQPKYYCKSWLKAAFLMLIYSGMQTILGQADIVMLGAMRSPGDVGLYAASSRLAFLLVYVMMASEIILAPIIARFYGKEEKERLQKILTRAVRIAFLSVLPFGLILIFAGGNILLLFGHEFMAAKTALLILAVGRLADVAAGSGALLLGMTGYERTVAIIFSGAALENVILNALLIPKYGIEGAAFALVISLVGAKLLLSMFAVKNAGLCVTIFGTLLGGKPVRIGA